MRTSAPAPAAAGRSRRSTRRPPISPSTNRASAGPTSATSRSLISNGSRCSGRSTSLASTSTPKSRNRRTTTRRMTRPSVPAGRDSRGEPAVAAEGRVQDARAPARSPTPGSPRRPRFAAGRGRRTRARAQGRRRGPDSRPGSAPPSGPPARVAPRRAGGRAGWRRVACRRSAPGASTIARRRRAASACAQLAGAGDPERALRHAVARRRRRADGGQRPGLERPARGRVGAAAATGRDQRAAHAGREASSSAPHRAASPLAGRRRRRRRWRGLSTSSASSRVRVQTAKSTARLLCRMYQKS